MNLTGDAILYYADNPVDFVEDIILAKPDPNQRDILNSVARYPMLGPWNREECGGKLAGDLVFDNTPLSEDTLYCPYTAPAMGYFVGRDRQVVEK